jgi:ABC-type multidrug transport system fused ATPase/permease subunit
MIIVTVAVSGPYFVKLAIDEGIGKNDLNALKNIVLIYLVISVIQLVTNFYRVRLMSRVGQHVLYDVRMAMFGTQKQQVSATARAWTVIPRDQRRARSELNPLLAIVRNLLGIVGILIAMLTLTSPSF